MNKYPLIKLMGLEIKYIEIHRPADKSQPTATGFIKADDLEEALQNAPVTYAPNGNAYSWSTGETVHHTFEARLVCVQPKKLKTKAERIAELISEYVEAGNVIGGSELNEEIEKILELPE